MSWLVALRNEISHEQAVFGSYLTRRGGGTPLETLPEDLVGRVLRSGRSWEGWLNGYIQAYASPEHTSIDVGANVGVHTLNMARVSREVISLEPQKAAYNCLLSNISGLDNVRSLCCAASECDGVAAMRHATSNRGASHLVSSGGDEIVSTIRLDDIPLSGPVRLIKIDVEGHEREALAGATGILTRDRPVVIIEDTTKSREILKGFDYKITRISRQDFLCTPYA